MVIDGEMFEDWQDELIEHFFGDADSLDFSDEITILVHEESCSPPAGFSAPRHR
jgi:hypothetical protein